MLLDEFLSTDMVRYEDIEAIFARDAEAGSIT
jgi:hypothetical protein